MYTDIANNLQTFELILPDTIVPTPKNTDYEVGFIRRYFAQRANDSDGHIFEISFDGYDEIVDNPLWNCIDIKWRLTGPIDIIYKMDGTIDDVGVRTANRTTIANASKKMKNIGLYLPNLLQFHK